MKINELRSLPTDSLKAKIIDLRIEIGIEKKNIAATGVASKKVKYRSLRRTLAQILTILNERGVKA